MNERITLFGYRRWWNHPLWQDAQDYQRQTWNMQPFTLRGWALEVARGEMKEAEDQLYAGMVRLTYNDIVRNDNDPPHR